MTFKWRGVKKKKKKKKRVISKTHVTSSGNKKKNEATNLNESLNGAVNSFIFILKYAKHINKSHKKEKK